MANNCFYTMRVEGKKDDVMEFHKRMQDYDAPNHLFRMFDASIINEQENNDGSFTIEVSGDCAWSIESCCRASGYSEGVDLLAVNSKELGLVGISIIMMKVRMNLLKISKKDSISRRI